MTEQIQCYRAPWMHFYRSKSSLDSLKSVFKVFKGKLSLGAPVQYLLYFWLCKLSLAWHLNDVRNQVMLLLLSLQCLEQSLYMISKRRSSTSWFQTTRLLAYVSRNSIVYWVWQSSRATFETRGLKKIKRHTLFFVKLRDGYIQCELECVRPGRSMCSTWVPHFITEHECIFL